MSALLDKFLTRRNSAADTVMAIARREAEGKPARGDDAKLAEAMTVAGIDAGRYEAMVAVYRQAAELADVDGAALQANLDDAEGDIVRARAAVATEDQRWQEARKAHEAKVVELGAAVGTAQAAANSLKRRAAKLDQLKRANPELFEEPAPDLTHVTPMYGDNLPTFRDDDAPVVYVSWEAWEAEDRRRRALMAEAHADAREAWEEGRRSWFSTLTKRLSGAMCSDEPYPTFKLPTWRDVAGRVA